MEIKDIVSIYAKSQQSAALVNVLDDKDIRKGYIEGAIGSAMAVLFASVAHVYKGICLFVFDDSEEAGYFYHDLTQMLNNQDVLFFPSSYRRQTKYGQRDSANEILRTEVMGRLLSIRQSGQNKALYIVSCPEALSELVISQKRMDERTIVLAKGECHDITALTKQMSAFGFHEVDYVYEPGQFAVRGSIIDVFSYSSEYPFRIDFFGDEIDSIRTFEVQSQLSKDKRDSIEIVPELATLVDEKVTFLNFLPEDTVILLKDYAYCKEKIDKTYQDGFSQQAVKERLEGLTEMEQHEAMRELTANSMLVNGAQFATDMASFRQIEFGAKPTDAPQATISLDVTAQPLFHKNFDLLSHSLEDYILKGYKIYILADSSKQNERLKEILGSEERRTKKAEVNGNNIIDGNQDAATYYPDASVSHPGAPGMGSICPVDFTPVLKTLHAGYADNKLKICLFTDHQIFDRFHKYSLRSDTARAGKMALTMKELQEMEPGDYIVHVDYGIGRFAGLVRVPSGNSYQEVIRIITRTMTK